MREDFLSGWAGLYVLYGLLAWWLLTVPRRIYGKTLMAVSSAVLKLNHATAFTTIETQFLTIWNALQDAGQGALAADLLFAGLQAEHFLSTLDHDPANRTAEETQTFDQLNAVFQSFVARGNAVLSGVVVSK